MEIHTMEWNGAIWDEQDNNRDVKRRRKNGPYNNNATSVTFEQLPIELLQTIFIKSRNFELPLVSKRMYNALGYHLSLGKKMFENQVLYLPMLPYDINRIITRPLRGRLLTNQFIEVEEQTLVKSDELIKKEDILKKNAKIQKYATRVVEVMDITILNRRFITKELLELSSFNKDKKLRFLTIEEIKKEKQMRRYFWKLRKTMIKKNCNNKSSNDDQSNTIIGENINVFGMEIRFEDLNENKIQEIFKKHYIYSKFPLKFSNAPFTDKKLKLIKNLWKYNLHFEDLSLTIVKLIEEERRNICSGLTKANSQGISSRIHSLLGLEDDTNPAISDDIPLGDINEYHRRVMQNTNAAIAAIQLVKQLKVNILEVCFMLFAFYDIGGAE